LSYGGTLSDPPRRPLRGRHVYANHLYSLNLPAISESTFASPRRHIRAGNLSVENGRRIQEPPKRPVAATFVGCK